MAGIKMTNLICFDDHRLFTEDIKKRFSDTTRYRVESYGSPQEFINSCRREREARNCKVAIIGVPDSREQFDKINEMTLDVKKADPQTGLILLVPVEKMDDLKKAVRFNIDAYIPLNSNAVTRIHNSVKRIISEQNIIIFRKRRNFSLYFLLGFLLLMALLILIAWLKLPQYF